MYSHDYPSDVHKPLFKEEDLLDELLVTSWTTGDARLREYMNMAISFLRPRGMDAPSLLNLCACLVRKEIGSSGQTPSERREQADRTCRLLPQHLRERFTFDAPI